MTYYLMFTLYLFWTMEIILDKKQIWAIFLLELKMGHKMAETPRNINNAFGSGIANGRTVRWRFKKYPVKETRALTMRSAVAGHWELTTIDWGDHWRWSSYNYTKVAKELHVDHSMVVQHLKQIGKMKKLSKWMPHVLTANQKSRHFEELSSLILRNNKKPFLDQIEMCDEKRKVDNIL